MTPNVSRLLIKWGVDEIIGDDLVQCTYINMRRTDGTIIQRTELVPKVVKEFGFPVSPVVMFFEVTNQFLAAKSEDISGGSSIGTTCTQGFLKPLAVTAFVLSPVRGSLKLHMINHLSKL